MAQTSPEFKLPPQYARQSTPAITPSSPVQTQDSARIKAEKAMKTAQLRLSAPQEKRQRKKARNNEKKRRDADIDRRGRELMSRHQKAATDYSNDSILQQMEQLMTKTATDTTLQMFERERYVWTEDSVTETLDELMATMRVKDGRYMSSRVNPDSMVTDIYLYFDLLPDSTLSPLHLCIQHCPTLPITLTEVHFLVDNDDFDVRSMYTYFLPPVRSEKIAVNDTLVVERCDVVVSDSKTKDAVYALTHCLWARMTLHGLKGANILQPLTEEQLVSLYNTLQLYQLLSKQRMVRNVVAVGTRDSMKGQDGCRDGTGGPSLP